MSDNTTKKLSNSKFVIAIIIAIVTLMILANSLYIVKAQEEAVVLNFGKFEKIVGPGPHVKIPFVQKYYKVNTKEIKIMNFGFYQKSGENSTSVAITEESHLLTGDSNIMDIRWSIQYQITDPKAWLFNVYDKGNSTEKRNQTIRDISFSAVNKTIGDNSLNRLLDGGKRSALVTSALNELNTRVDNVGLGITILEIEFDTMAAPEGRVYDAFKNVQAATVLRKKLEDEGELYKSSQIPIAEGKAAKTKSIAEGYAIERENLANGDVAKFKAIYEEYKKNPAITRKRMYYEMMESLAKDSKTTDLIDKDLTNFIPFKSLGGVE